MQARQLALPTTQCCRLALEERLQGEHLGRVSHPTLLLVLRRFPELEAERQIVFHGHVGVQGVVW
jgi:hypothetical protein